MKVIDQSGWQRSLGMRKGGREISKEQRQLDGIGQAMPLATKGEGWRTPHTAPLKPVALSNCNKYLKQHLRVGPSAAKTQVRGNMHHLRMLFWLLGLDCWYPRYRSCTTRHIYQPAALLPLSTTMVAATGSHQHPQAECFPLFWKKIPTFIASSCTASHNVTVWYLQVLYHGHPLPGLGGRMVLLMSSSVWLLGRGVGKDRERSFYIAQASGMTAL